MQKVVMGLALIFFGFILWIIYQANTGSDNVFFNFIADIPYGDKIGHFCLFGMLTLLAIVALRFKTVKVAGAHIFYGAAVVGLFVIGEEISQLFFASRTFDLVDLAANFVGIFAAAAFCQLLRRDKPPV